ncbi:MAG: hypothetical protein RLZZ325_1159, partial [Pseudomonadota bacterium]
ILAHIMSLLRFMLLPILFWGIADE